MNDGVRLYEADHPDQAEQSLERAVTADPSYARAHLILALFYRRTGRPADAERSARLGLELDDAPDAVAAELAFTLGRARTELAREQPDATIRDEMVERAIEAYAATIQLRPDHYQAHYRLGESFETLDRPTKADGAYRTCIDVQPRYVPCSVKLGNMYIAYGFTAPGLAVLEASAALNDTRAMAWHGLGRGYRAVDRPSDAAEALKKALTLDPKAPDILFNLGMTLADLGQRKEATEALKAFLRHADASVPEHLVHAANSTIARVQDVI